MHNTGPLNSEITSRSIVTPDSTSIGSTLGDAEVEDQIAAMTRRSVIKSAIAGGIGLAGFSWLNWLAYDTEFDPQLQWPFRRMHQFNQRVAEQILGTSGLAPEFPQSEARMPRANGRVGLKSSVDVKKWRLSVTQPKRMTREFSLSEIRELPKVEMVTELKCIEGWSEVVHWVGVRLVDFLSRFGLGRRDGQSWPRDMDQTPSPKLSTSTRDLYRFVKVSTPDESYYVGLDLESMIHPQTLLCYEMNGKPLAAEHGAPLRLVITVKYGIKNIKRIGNLSFTDEQPGDYWAERGYDWYAGL
jgi:DMSO/TMAO reductase YedYZ molybdopterin-dependent catalytic subunit